MDEKDSQFKRVTEFLALRMSQMQSYHDHKETMAHAAGLVNLTLMAGVLSAAQWPPPWVPSFCISSKAVAFFGVMATWFLIHVYMRWQLRKRRMAAIFVLSLLRVLRSWSAIPPAVDQLQAWSEPSPPAEKIHSLIDLFIPWKWSNVIVDEDFQGYPTALVNELRRANSGAIEAEIIVTCGSLLIGLFLVVRALT